MAQNGGEGMGIGKREKQKVQFVKLCRWNEFPRHRSLWSDKLARKKEWPHARTFVMLCIWGVIYMCVENMIYMILVIEMEIYLCSSCLD